MLKNIKTSILEKITQNDTQAFPLCYLAFADAFASKIAKALQNNTALTKLDLTGNNFTQAGINIINSAKSNKLALSLEVEFTNRSAHRSSCRS